MQQNQPLKFYYIDYSKITHIKDPLENKGGRKYYYSLDIGNNLHAIIPLRTKLIHKYGIQSVNGKGLDFSKALIFNSYDLNNIIKGEALLTDSREYNVLYSKQSLFLKKFNDCVESYVQALATPIEHRKVDQKNLISYSTLQNFHSELNISSRVKQQSYLISIKYTFYFFNPNSFSKSNDVFL